jgi:hypothetical protein
MSTLVNNSTLMIAAGAASYYPAGYPAVTRFDGTNVIGATTYSVPILVQYCDRLSVHVSCPSTGSPNGIVTIQGSNDVGLYEAQATPFTGGPVETGGSPISDPQILNWATLAVWDELTFAYAANTTVTGATSVILTVQQCASRWVRVVWTNPSGSALLTLRVQQKSIGGR